MKKEKRIANTKLFALHANAKKGNTIFKKESVLQFLYGLYVLSHKLFFVVINIILLFTSI